MKILRILLLVPFLMAFQCDEDDDFFDDLLIDTGLLGRWEISNEAIGGISDLLPKFGRFYEFEMDDNPDDLQGLFLYEDEFGVYPGVFTVDEANQTIIFQREERAPVTYMYSLDGDLDYLVFTFIEDGATWEQGWIRRY